MAAEGNRWVLKTSIVQDYEEEKNSQELFKFCLAQAAIE
jgi:hypothetical protein